SCSYAYPATASYCEGSFSTPQTVTVWGISCLIQLSSYDWGYIASIAGGHIYLAPIYASSSAPRWYTINQDIGPGLSGTYFWLRFSASPAISGYAGNCYVGTTP